MSQRSNNRNFIGRGWSFPPHFDLTSKGVTMTEGVEDINNSLTILLSTIVGERVMDMRYGCNLEDMVFETLDTSSITFLVTKIEKAILFYEARIEVERIELNTQNLLEGIILIEIDYIISATNSRYNFVYPFWREEGTELNSLVRLNS
ncbi:GPW/gp25 family protein [Pontibacter qinzhouensis]|uniref:GPW/gp25 family protein n=1 Tax=Pontibacter qinzhouensis TaxID=2603253 RepID=A0A5C8KCG3_9BACT|nr:GPW/gp25 family protein [Pontibacter qinzhouensis]TXK50294.1 GPW/gp25 family protein [Pontibacter qinzhouensis]